MRLPPSGLLAGLLVLGAPPATALTLQRGVEAPPARYADGPTLSGQTWVLALPDARQVDQLCRMYLGPPPQRGGSWWGCYNPRMDAVIVPAKGAWEEHERKKILAHEFAHARGWRHNADGRGTSPESLPPAGEALTLARTDTAAAPPAAQAPAATGPAGSGSRSPVH